MSESTSMAYSSAWRTRTSSKGGFSQLNMRKGRLNPGTHSTVAPASASSSARTTGAASMAMTSLSISSSVRRVSSSSTDHSMRSQVAGQGPV